jgi:hypothetical protein
VALSRVAAWKRAEQGKAVLIVVDGKKIEIDHASLTTLDTAEKIKAELQSQASLSNMQLPKIFIHLNRDGSVAVAVGAEPRVWPEDETDEIVPFDVRDGGELTGSDFTVGDGGLNKAGMP